MGPRSERGYGGLAIAACCARHDRFALSLDDLLRFVVTGRSGRMVRANGAAVIENYEATDVFLGIDVGKSFHHAVALSRAGKVLLDQHLTNDEADISKVIANLRRKGNVLLVVDQPSDIGAFPVAIARASEVEVAYLPGLAMRRIADLHPGNAKSDRKDALVMVKSRGVSFRCFLGWVVVRR